MDLKCFRLGRRDLVGSRLRRRELEGSRLGWRLGCWNISTLGRNENGGSRARSLTQLEVADVTLTSRKMTGLGVSKLGRTELRSVHTA